jgi:hypothetical protein
MKMISPSLIMVLAVFSGTGALACNPNNPADLSCPPTFFLDRTFGSVSYYMNNGPARFAEVTACTHPVPGTRENPAWCAAAMQAQRLTTGAR